MNYFSPKTAAERYKEGRPRYHHLTIERIKTQLNITNKLNLAADVACGTGLSTVPLTVIANKVTGIDIAPEMLALAEPHENVSYTLGTAESLKLHSGSVDLITVASGLHWFDTDAFFTEAKRVLKPTCYVVVYENFYWGGMTGCTEFKQWHNEVYQTRYKPPQRNKVNWDEEKLRSSGFRLTHSDSYENAMLWNSYQCMRYFTTQSNIINAVENGSQTIQEVESWLNNELETFFGSSSATKEVLFGNWIRYLQRID